MRNIPDDTSQVSISDDVKRHAQHYVEHHVKQYVTIEERGADTFKVITTQKRVSKQAVERTLWKKFGDAVHTNDCTFIDQVIKITPPNQDTINIKSDSVGVTDNVSHPVKQDHNKKKYISKKYALPHMTVNKVEKERIPFVTVKVSNIPETLTEMWLRTLSGNIGKVVRCKIPKDQHGNLLNFAFVSFLNLKEANQFVDYVKGKSMDYCILDAKIIDR